MASQENPQSQGLALDFAAGWYDLLTLVPGERRLREMTIELAGTLRIYFVRATMLPKETS